MKFLITVGLINLLPLSLAVAKPVKVILDTQKEIVQYHTPAVLFGLRYESGAIIGSGLFSDADLKAGVLEKTLQLDETEKVANCEYQWMISSDKIGNGPSDPVYGKIDLPIGFDGIVKNKCNIDLVKGEIVLSLAPLKLEKLEVYVPSNSLTNRKAKSVLAMITPRGETTDKFQNFSLSIAEATKLPMAKIGYYFAREPMIYKLQTFWSLKAGGLEQDERDFKDSYFEVR